MTTTHSHVRPHKLEGDKDDHTSIWGAATLAAYMIPNFAEARRLLNEAKASCQVSVGKLRVPLSADIDWRFARESDTRDYPVMLFSIPDGKMSDTMVLHMACLREYLLGKGVETSWVSALPNSRARAVHYTITPSAPDSRFVAGLPTDIAAHRRLLLHVAIGGTGSRMTGNIWPKGDMDTRLSASGLFDVASPRQALAVILNGPLEVSQAGIDYKITFTWPPYHIAPSSFATIFCPLLEGTFDRALWEASLTKAVQCTGIAGASVRNLRPNHDETLVLADASTISTAHALTMFPMPGEVFFRTTFDMNRQVGNFKPHSITEYHMSKKQKFEEKYSVEYSYTVYIAPIIARNRQRKVQQRVELTWPTKKISRTELDGLRMERKALVAQIMYEGEDGTSIANKQLQAIDAQILSAEAKTQSEVSVDPVNIERRSAHYVPRAKPAPLISAGASATTLRVAAADAETPQSNHTTGDVFSAAAGKSGANGLFNPSSRPKRKQDENEDPGGRGAVSITSAYNDLGVQEAPSKRAKPQMSTDVVPLAPARPVVN